MKITTLLIFCLFTLQSVAHEVNNGGDAIGIGDRYYSFDLYEHGVERNPFFMNQVSTDPKVTDHVNRALPSSFPRDLLAKKLSELRKTEPIVAWALIETMRIYEWIILSSPLPEVDDLQDSLWGPNPPGLAQAALRQNRRIFISRPIWEKMDQANKAALVLHEAWYALTTPKRKDGVGPFMQDSRYARRLTGFLFTEDLEKKGFEWLLAHGDFISWGRNPEWPLFRSTAEGVLQRMAELGPIFVVIAAGPNIWRIDQRILGLPEAQENICYRVGKYQGRAYEYAVSPSFMISRYDEPPFFDGPVDRYENGWVGYSYSTDNALPAHPSKEDCLRYFKRLKAVSLPGY